MRAPRTPTFAVPSRTTSTAYRQRKRRGIDIYRVPVGPRIKAALVTALRLTPAELKDREKVQAELYIIVKQWSGEWEYRPLDFRYV